MVTDNGATRIEPWQWDEATWRGHVERVRAGCSLAAAEWPGGARVAVALSFDCDHETIPLRDAETGPGKLSQVEYGSRVGSRRIMDLLDRRGIRATFFMPAVSALLHPADAFAHPMDVVDDCDLTSYEKRAILSSWAADACAVPGPSRPATVVSFDDILYALQLVESEPEPAADRGKASGRHLGRDGPDTLSIDF